MADSLGNTKTNLDALYRIVYREGTPENAIPEQTLMQKQIPFKVRIGEEYKVPVILSLPGGITYGGENSSTASGAYELVQTIPAQTAKLAVKGYQMTIREVIGYGAAKGARGGPESFQDSVGFIFEGMTVAMRRAIEWEILHGQSYTGCGTVSAGSASPITISEATWAPGAFIGAKGRVIIAAACSGGAGTVPTSLRSGSGVISSVNFATRQITYTGTITSIAATDAIFFAGVQATDGSTLVGQVAFPSGISWNSGLGMFKASSTTGTVWGQDNTSYELIRGETQTAGSTDLSFDTTGLAMGKLFNKGATGTFNMIVSAKTWTNLISPEIAKARHDESYKPEKVTIGSEAIEFRHLTGKLNIYAHPMVKEGDALIYAPSLWDRVGSTDLTFEQDVGANVKKIFLHVSNKNGFEVRAYSDQSAFTRRLGYNCYINNIVNT